MYPVNSNFHSLSTQDAPKTRARIYFIGDSVDCTNDSDVQTNGTLLVWANGDTDSNGRIGEDGIRWDEYFNRDKNIEIGAAVSSQIEIPLINSDGALNNFSFGRCKVYLDVFDTANSAWRDCPMGVYIIDLPTKRRVKLISASGYDQMQLLDTICDSWWAGLNWSGGITLSALLTSMANRLGITVSTATASAILNSSVSYTEAPFACVEVTYREVLEYIAEATGTIARFDRDGALDLRWFDEAVTSEQETFIGNLVSIADGTNLTIEGISAPINLTQSGSGTPSPDNVRPISGRTGLNVYRTGKNLAPLGLTPTSTTGVTVSDISNGYKITATSASIYLFARFDLYDASQFAGKKLTISGTSTADHTQNPQMRLRHLDANGVSVSDVVVNGSGSRTLSIPQNAEGTISLYLYNTASATSGRGWETTWTDIMLEIGESASTYVPHAGSTYAVDWTSEAGTVYGGTLDVVSGVLKARPYIASYNGETLVGPWVSSMDVYTQGGTPTVGAQVVDMGGAETSYQLTPQEVEALIGQNYIWASNNESITVSALYNEPVTIDADTVGNTLLDIDIAEYQAAAVDLLKVKIAEDDIGVTVGSGTNQYTIVNNLFLNGNTATIITNRATPIYNRLNGLGAYTPIQAKLIYDWSLEAGDIINIVRGGVTYPVPVFQQTLSWRGGYVTANILADGDNVRPVMDYNERVSYRMASEMSQKVGDNEIISKINQTAESIQIQASKVDLAGYVTFTNLSTPGQTEIDGGNIYGGTLTLGGNNNVNGTMTVKDANGNTAATVNNNGITINGSTSKTVLDGGVVKIQNASAAAQNVSLEYVPISGTSPAGYIQKMYTPSSGARQVSEGFWWYIGNKAVAEIYSAGDSVANCDDFVGLGVGWAPISGSAKFVIDKLRSSDIEVKRLSVYGVLDIANRRVAATSLYNIGWHRLLKVGSVWRGSSPFQIDIFIGRERNNSNNEQHRITLLVGYDSYAFVNETSGSNTQLIQAIRYTNDGTNGFVDILYGSVAQNNVYADFTVHCQALQQSNFTPESLQEVAASPSGETVLATYDFAQNVSNSKTAGFNKTEYTGNIASSGTVSFDYNPTAKITVFRADSSATPVSVLLDQWDGITYLSRNNSLATVSVSGKSVTITNASAAYVNYIAEIFN